MVYPATACCRIEEQTLSLDTPTPFGESVRSELARIGALTCPVRYADGSTGQVAVRVEQAHDVVFRSGTPQDGSCQQLCFSELRLSATVSLVSLNGSLSLSAPTTLRELERGDGFVFELSANELTARGHLQTREPGLRITRTRSADESVVTASGPCEATAARAP